MNTPADDRSTSKDAHPRTLLDLLLEKFPDTPRKRAKEWILAGRVSLAGTVIRKPNHPLPDPPGALELQGRRLAALVLDEVWPIHPRLSLLYLDSSLVIVNKGAGLLSVPAPITDLSALSILTDFLAGKLRGLGHRTAEHRLPAAFRQLAPLPVHRLDQFTTGVLCLAMNPSARAALIEQFSAHTASRQYVAFVDGRPKTPRSTWRHWLRFDDETLRQHVSNQPGGTDALESITHYEVLEEFTLRATGRIVSKMRFKLETGRTHQIRAQAAHEGLPLIGDRTYHPLYHSSKRDRAIAPIACERQALHAEELELTHPVTAQRMKWSAPLPADLRQLDHTLHASQSSTRHLSN
jgi:23S rRNA pseudouridine1911/1915/1917 synthase